MNKKERTRIYFNFLKKRTALAKKKIDLSNYQPKPKQIFKPEAIEIVEAIKKGDFGCQQLSVYNLVQAIVKMDLPPLENHNENYFCLDPKQLQIIPWACYSTTEEEEEENYIDCYFVFEEQDITYLSSSPDTTNAGSGPWHLDPSDTRFTKIDFATDTQIKLLLKDKESFKAIDSILGFLTEK